MLAWSLLFSRLFLLAASAQNGGPPLDPDPGISQALAQERTSRVSDLRYDLALTVPLDSKARITGRQVVSFTLRDAGAPLSLDFDPDRSGRVLRIQADGASIDARQVNGHLVLPASALHAGANRVAIEFEAGDAPLNRNDDFLYTIFVPARAHEALPCFDQPDLKARWTLALDVPEGWATLANGAETSSASRDRRTRVTFAETQPVSTYLFAFAAGKFSVERGERNGRAMRMFHRETDATKVARNRDAIFDLHAAALDWMRAATRASRIRSASSISCWSRPFSSAAWSTPAPSSTTPAACFLDASATQNERLDRASVISHETAHMWFGDLVTMRWFDDVWMKEVFANFMAAKIVNPSFPAINHELRFLLDYYPAAYDVDRTDGSNPIRQHSREPERSGHALRRTSSTTRRRSSCASSESLVGADAFRDGLRDYLKRFSFGNATLV